MKTILTALLFSIPTFCFACIDVSGTYNLCKIRNLGWSSDNEISISIKNDRLSLLRSTVNDETLSEFFLDGRTLSTVEQQNGRPVIVKKRGTCEGSEIKLVTVTDTPELNFSFMAVSKDAEGRLSFYEVKNGRYMGETTCDPVR